MVLDNRKFIEKLEEIGELVRIKQEVDWDMEAGAIYRRAAELQKPAILMENIRDYPGWRYFGNVVASFRRFACMMGLNPDTPRQALMEEYFKRVESPIKPILINEAPCQENIIMDDDVNLLRLPAPMVHEGDGGRYLVTWALSISKDPDTGWVNWGIYRNMVHNERYLGGLVLPYSDRGRIFYQKYVPQNKPMPFAIAICPEPVAAVASAISVGVEVNEADIAGAIVKEPLQLVKCKTVDLEVPAYSEVVLEGEMIPNVTVEEGPFGEYTGFRSSPRMPRTLFKVNCITYRNDPILGISNMGTPVDDWDIIMSIGFGHRVHKALESQGIPVKGVNYVPEGCGHLCVVSTETPYANIATQIANILFGTRGPHMYLHHLIVVGPDVNPFNLVEVIHSLATQCDPSRGIQIRYNETSNPLTPHPTFEERKWSKGSKVVYDCTWPVWWSKEIEIPVKSSFNSIYPKNIQKKVLDNWNNYGF